MCRFLILFVLLPCLISAEEQVRSWKNKKGNELKGKLLDFVERFDEEKKETFREVKLEVTIPPGNEKKGEEPEKRLFTILLDDFSEPDKKYVLDWDWSRVRQGFLSRCLQVVMGEPRDIQKQRLQQSKLYDLIYLRDGSVNKGIVQNTRFSLHAVYGKLELHRDKLAALQLGGEGGNLDQMISVNNNRFSGFLDLPVDAAVGTEANYLLFESDNGQKESIRKERIERIIFHVRENELVEIDNQNSLEPPSAFVRLKNGDYFEGKVAAGEFSITANGRIATVPVGEVKRVEISGRDRPQTMVLKKNGTQIKGVFSQEDLPVTLDIGPEFKIYHSRMDLIYCETGYRPVGQVILINEARDARLYIEKDPTGKPFGVLSRMSSSSPFHGILQAEDHIVSINNQIPDFESKEDSYEKACEALFEDKAIPYIVLGVRRGDQSLQFTVVDLSSQTGGAGG